MTKTKKFFLEMFAAAAIVTAVAGVTWSAVGDEAERSTNTELREQSVSKLYMAGRKYFLEN